MGNFAVKAVSKSGTEAVRSSYKSLLEIPATDIDGNKVERLGSVMEDKNNKEMVQLHSQFRDQGFEILAFPCNQFGKQEPGTEAEIKAFAAGYGVQFPMFSKIEVNGKCPSPVYAFLRRDSSLYDAQKNEAGMIPWNFAKFLVNAEGRVVSYHHSTVSPLELSEQVQAML